MSKQSQMTNFFKQPHNTSTSDNQNSNITKKHNLDTTQNVDEPSLKKVKILKYKDSYIEYGFTYLNENGKDVPQCVICGMTFANASLKPNKLIRHMETSHAQYKKLFSNEHVTKIKKIPMSNDTISRRINTMSNDIENQLSEKIKKSIFYAIQLDESTDINNEAILLMYVSAVNTRIFKVMCEEMGSGFKNLLLHTHVRWLSRGKVLTRLFELKTEVEVFLRDNKSPLSDYFENNVWLAKLAYLSDIFSILNELNISMQGPHTNLFISYNKIDAFLKKIRLWTNRIKNYTFDMFPNFFNMTQEKILTKNEINEMCIIIEEHLGRLREKMSKYFDPTKDIRKNCNWVINPFVQSDQNILSLTNEEKLIELSADVGLHEIFRSNKNIGQFWIKVQNEYPSLAEEALKLLIPFSTTYLCENGFSTLTTIKNKTRNRLEISSAMRISLTKSIKPRIDEIISHQQQQPSH
ncbi:SCAN domain-containing protein 3-like [Metopolophium dirhodum]|uniref:SCAN domain-containing protein 3-like n=1 Tax=Metopolophium dirhodum TaxID=44670 RepID=UPI00298F4F01|nr:SCAN domain-containing protein 3-like [Metopolophium dirhodum]